LSEKERKMSIYAVRTTSGQERTVADLVASRIGLKKLAVASVLVPEVIKGYIFVEAAGPHFVDEAISGVRHARARTRGMTTVSSVERFIITKPVIEDLNVSDTIEVVSGPFKGSRAKITSIDRVKQEVTIELLEEGFAILPITVHADYVKLVERTATEGKENARKETS